MAPTVQRAKTAFQFYQSDCLADIKKELGSTMGEAMTVLSHRWKSLVEEERSKYLQLEAQDRQRFEEESSIADQEAMREQERRRQALEVQ